MNYKKRKEFENLTPKELYDTLAPWNPVRRLEWYRLYKPKTYAWLEEKTDEIVQGWATKTNANGVRIRTQLGVGTAALNKYIFDIESILEEYPNRLAAFYTMLNNKLNRR